VSSSNNVDPGFRRDDGVVAPAHAGVQQ